MDEVKIFALGGLDEDGKNMYVVEINENIFVLECGLKYPDENEQLGIEMEICDFSYLIKNKERIRAIFISHGNDDVMGAITNFIKVCNVPIYSTPLTSYIIEKRLKNEGIKKYDIHRIQRNMNIKISGIDIKTFGVTTSIPDSIGIAIKTSHGYIVYSSEFIFDFDLSLESFKTDLTRLAKIGEEGVLCLLSESVASDRNGHSSPNHKLTHLIESYFEEAGNRICITLFNQNIFRAIEVIELADKYNKKFVIYDETLKDYLKEIAKLGYYHVPVGLEIPTSKFSNDMDDILVIIAGNGKELFNKVRNICDKEDKFMEFRESDTVLIASPAVNGIKKDANNMENALYKETINVYAIDKKRMFSMHAAKEDLKMMIYLTKPKHYMPVKGEYTKLITNANIALNMDFQASKIIVLDNGQIATFKDGELQRNYNRIELEDVLVDGNDSMKSSGLVLRDRETLSTDGAIIVGVVLNQKTKKIIGGPDVQSRGVIYLKDSENILKEIGEIMEKTVNHAVLNNQYDNLDVRMSAREEISKYIFRQTGKKPMILPSIIEINSAE